MTDAYYPSARPGSTITVELIGGEQDGCIQPGVNADALRAGLVVLVVTPAAPGGYRRTCWSFTGTVSPLGHHRFTRTPRLAEEH